MKKILFSFFLVSLLFSCQNTRYQNTKIVGKTIAVDSIIPPDSTCVKVIDPYRKKMIKEVNTVFTYTPKDLVRTDGKLQSTLGNLMADLSYTSANPVFHKMTGKNIDFVLLNYGGIRSGIFTGDVTFRNAFQLMPFENMYVVATLEGEKIEELILYFIKNNKAHPLSKQLQLTISENGYTLNIHGKPFDRTKTYHVLTSDYLQSGGDRMDFFKDPIALYTLDYKVRDGIVDYFKSVDTLVSKIDNRVILK